MLEVYGKTLAREWDTYTFQSLAKLQKSKNNGDNPNPIKLYKVIVPLDSTHLWSFKPN